MFELYKRHIKKNTSTQCGEFPFNGISISMGDKARFICEIHDILFDGKQFAEIYLYCCITAHEMIKSHFE